MKAMGLDIDIGRIVAGKYELLRLVGRGAMGEVWLARHTTLDEQFAIKFLNHDADGENGDPLARFLQEAQIAARLSRKSRHIVRVSDHGQEGEVSYLVMELLEGESLEDAMQTRGRLPIALTRHVVAQIARGLAVAHAEGVFHRDLKPANVFLCEDEDGQPLVKILDFGIARTSKAKVASGASPRATGRGVVLGTPSHMSPEQARGIGNLDHRCDLWALAVIAYEALVGDIPHVGDTIEDVYASVCTHRMLPIGLKRPDLGPRVEHFFECAFAKDVRARFQTADAFAHAFEEAMASVPEGVGTQPIAVKRVTAREEPMPTQAHLAVTMTPLIGPPGKVVGAIALAAAAVVAVLAVMKLAPSSSDARARVAPSAVSTGAAAVVAAPPARALEPAIPALDVSALPRAADTPVGTADAGLARAEPPPRAARAAPRAQGAAPPPPAFAAPPPPAPAAAPLPLPPAPQAPAAPKPADKPIDKSGVF